MISGSQDQGPDLSIEAAQLYREDTFTDRKAGTIRRLTPVTKDGSTDSARQVLYMGQAQLLTPMGALPLSFEIPASSLGEAVDGFAAQAKVAVEQAVAELKELQREAASSIVVPETGGGMGGLGGPGRVPGGGKIQLR